MEDSASTPGTSTQNDEDATTLLYKHPSTASSQAEEAAGEDGPIFFHPDASWQSVDTLKSFQYIKFDTKSSPISLTPKKVESDEIGPKTLCSLLRIGFGIRNLSSLQDALKEQERRRRLKLLEYLKRLEMAKEEEGASVSSGLSEVFLEKMGGIEEEMSDIHGIYPYFRYEIGEEADFSVVSEIPEKPQILDETSIARKNAEKYLKYHKILEFFKFLLIHLLSAHTDEPIEFLLELLDKCLNFRSGVINPPVLYEKEHLDRLFYLMDRMETGFIEKSQYETGMKTLFIGTYNKNPPLTPDGLVAKKYFIEEAYNSEVKWLGELIQVRPRYP